MNKPWGCGDAKEQLANVVQLCDTYWTLWLTRTNFRIFRCWLGPLSPWKLFFWVGWCLQHHHQFSCTIWSCNVLSRSSIGNWKGFHFQQNTSPLWKKWNQFLTRGIIWNFSTSFFEEEKYTAPKYHSVKLKPSWPTSWPFPCSHTMITPPTYADTPKMFFDSSKSLTPCQTLFISQLNCLHHLQFLSCHLVSTILSCSASHPNTSCVGKKPILWVFDSLYESGQALNISNPVLQNFPTNPFKH